MAWEGDKRQVNKSTGEETEQKAAYQSNPIIITLLIPVLVFKRNGIELNQRYIEAQLSNNGD
ncbi:hypothetical protein VoSk93_40440 [Vibrio owensii]